MKSRTYKHRQEVSSRDPIARSRRNGNRKGFTWSLILIFLLLLLLVILYFFFSNSRSEPSARIVKNFNEGWVFHLGDEPEASAPSFNDQPWRELNLPHDWSIEGEFSEEHPAGSGGGALPGGIGWYRKRFTVNQEMKGNCLFIDFDGVYMNTETWINGHYLGKRPYGYISFRHDLTPYLNYGSENVIAVRVDNSEQPNSRWYSGSGIYRNVWLTVTHPVHVDLWGTFVTTPEVRDDQATIQVKTRIKNSTDQTTALLLRTSILNANGKRVASIETDESPELGRSTEVTHELPLPHPHRWSIEDPYLYQVATEIIIDGQRVDYYTTPLGVRTFSFDPDKGFFLNGEPTKIKGVCMHHDLGCLGAAVNRRAIERQLEILKAMGVNSIRTAHNPPAPELLQLCDEMGFIVMNETFDMWRKRKTTYDYSKYFGEWHVQDLTDHMLRDRNHPSIFVWSIGNEVLEQWTHADADTLDIQQANLLLNLKREDEAFPTGDSLSVNSLLTQKLTGLAKTLDPTRPITAGNNEANPWNHLFLADTLDIIGLNYQLKDWDRARNNYPDKPFIATETTSALATRGYYRMPSDSAYIWPKRWDIPFHDSSYACSSYDNCHVPWGSTHEATWRKVKESDYVSGMYLWTGFDYLGEPTPFWFPARSSYFGVVDLAGFPKDAYYFYQSEWSDEPMLHVFPHWNWEEGEEVDVWVYYNQADEAELFLNGVSQGTKRKEEGQFHVSWRLTHQPGTLRVVTREKGHEVLSREVHTAGEPHQIRLHADREEILADGTDLSFITVEVLDKEGNLCPHANNLVLFELAGNGKIAGVDNGNPVSLEPFKASQRMAFHGKCLAVIQSGKTKGTLSLTATSHDLQPASLKIKMR